MARSRLEAGQIGRVYQRPGAMPYSFLKDQVLPLAGARLSSLALYATTSQPSPGIFSHVIAQCPHLARLCLSGLENFLQDTPNVNDILCEHLPRTWADSMEHLELGFIEGLLDKSLEAICEGERRLSRLKVLSIRNSESMSDEAIGRCVSKMTSLTTLDISALGQLTSQSFVRIFKGCTALESLSIGWNEFVTSESIGEIGRAHV